MIPVADIARHVIAILCFFAQNGYAIYDDVNEDPQAGHLGIAGGADLGGHVPRGWN